ncbi:MAG: hypothetical protein ACLP3C_23235 [Mycobacterium sp.]|uniref:hypothetical protein n=1 Tax=Mycobacterium sp. TaxID=1785 RepID=UPI003F97AC06
MTGADNTAASWREVAGQLTCEQAAQFEIFERSGDDPVTLLARAREMAADNVAGGVALSGSVTAPGDAVHTYGWQTYGGRTWREFDGSTRRVGSAVIRVVGRQFSDGRCERWISLSATHDEEFQAAQARELAASLQAIADETDRLA